MKFNQLASLLLTLFIFSCGNKTKSTQPTVSFQNQGHELIYKMVNKVGNYETLLSKKDVIYTYTYKTPDGKSDISTEKYIFDGELSYGLYEHHERTLPELEGKMEQGFDGNEYWLKHNGNVLTDDNYLKRVKFNRPTNFYWFAMFQKLLDPSLNYEYLGEKEINGKDYDLVKITFANSGDKPTDIYQVYINKKTNLIDQFLFTVADFGVMKTPFLMELDYEKVDGLLIPVKRQYKKSDWDANVSEEPWIDVTWSNIKFNNGLTKERFKK